jgi:hypothetical protein
MSEQHSSVRFRRGALVLLLGAAALLTASCGSRKSVYPVHGRVVDRNDKPAAGAHIFFHPTDPNYDDVNRPVATTDEDGRFSLATYTEKDGAPAGEYKITLTWAKPRLSPLDPEGKDQLGGELANPDRSKIRFSVQPGADNEVPEIKLPIP